MPSRRTFIAAAILAPWVAWALVRAFGLEWSPRVTGAMAFTPWVAAGSLLPLVVAIAVRRRFVALASLLTVAGFAAIALPRASGGPEAAPENARPLRAMTLNLEFGRGDAKSVVDLVRRERIQVLALTELTPTAVRDLDRAGLRRLLPNTILTPHPRPRGAGLYSTLPLRRIDATLPGDREGKSQPAGLLALPGGAPVEIRMMHPPPPLTDLNARIWKRTMRIQPSAGPGAPLRVLIGDFNATVDHREMRRLLDRGYKDAAEVVGNGLHMTWPSNRAYPALIAIDHVLVDRRASVTRTGTAEIPGTDHRALLAQLAFPR